MPDPSPDQRPTANKDNPMGTVRAGSHSSSHKAGPSVDRVYDLAHAGFKSFHARIANILRRDLCRYVQYALRRWKATPALAYVTAHRGRRGRR